jgi:hypothetical protein
MDDQRLEEIAERIIAFLAPEFDRLLASLVEENGQVRQEGISR